MTALEAGHFYASTGVVLEDVTGTDSTLAVRIAPQGNFKYTTTFIGDGGRVLATDAGETALLDLRRLTIFPTDGGPGDG